MALDGAFENRKTRRLARALGVQPWAAIGLLETFWRWCRRSAKNGRIDPDQWEDIADFIMWEKPADSLRDLLIGQRFVDEMGGWDWVHDWHHHADNTTRTYLYRRSEKFANGAEARIPKDGYRDDVETNRPNVETNGQNVELIAGARPEPEPEPEPEKKKRAAASKLVVLPPPPSSQNSQTANAGHPEFEDYRTAIHSFMKSTAPPPDDAIVMQIILAANGEPVEVLVEKFREFATTRHEPPKSYGFWPTVVAEWFRPANGRRARR